MEVEEMDRKEAQAEIPWIPTTPVKPVVPKSAPICTPVEGNSQIYRQANGAFACYEFSNGTEKNRESHDESVPAATITDIAGENGKICEKTASDNVSCWSGLGSAESMFPTEVASSSTTRVGDNNDLAVPSVISENSRDPHETSDIACCSKRTSQDDPAKKLDKDGTPPDKELCDPVVENVVTEGTNPDLAYDVKTPMKQACNVSLTEDTQTINTSSRRKKLKEGPITKRQYERRSRLNKSSTPTTEVSGDLPGKAMPESAKTSCQKSLNFDGGARDESSADRGNATVHPCKETGAAIQEIKVSLGDDMENFMNQAAENNYLSFCNNKQTPTVCPCEETGAVMQEIEVCLDYDMETFTKPGAENSYMSFCNNEQTISTSPTKTNPPGEKPKQDLTGNKYQKRKRLNKSPTCQIEMTGEQIGAMMPESKETPMRRFSDFDMGANDESAAHKEIVNVQMGDVVEETPVGLAHNQDTWIKQALNSYIPSPEHAQAPSTDPSKDYPLGEIVNVQMGDVVEETPVGLAHNQDTWIKRALNSYIPSPEGAQAPSTDPSKDNPPGEIVNVQMGDVVEETPVGLAHNQDTWIKRALNSYIPSPEDAQAPSTDPSKDNPPGEIVNVQMGDVVEETPVGLAHNQDTWIKQALNIYIPSPEDAQAPSTDPSKDNPPEEIVNVQMGDVVEETPVGLAHNQDTWIKRALNSYIPSPEDAQAPSTDPSKDNPPGEIVNVQMGDVVEETPVGLAHNQDTWIKQALSSYIEDPQAPSTDPSKDNPPGEKPEENPNSKRKCVRKKRLKRTSTPREMTGELTEPIMPEPTIISCKMSINFDNGGRDESNMCNESLPSDQNTSVKEMSNSHMSLSENTQAPSTCLPKSIPPGAKWNASNKNKRKGLPTAEDGNISNGQVSTIESQIRNTRKKETILPHALDMSRRHNMVVTLDAFGRCAYL